VAQIAALVLAVGGAAFPITTSADQSDNGGHDQSYTQDQNSSSTNNGWQGGDNGSWGDQYNGDNNGNNGGDDNDSGNGGHDNHHHDHDGNGDNGNGGGDNGGNGGGNPPPPTTATVVATTIVCGSESDLPNWGAGGHNVNSTTATDFVAANPDCHLTSGWSFQWAPDGTANPGDNTGAAASPWTTFGPTAANGTASVTIPPTSATAATWLREVWQDGYVPFSFNLNNQSNTDNVSAEFYCNIDDLNYDNYEEILNAVSGATYYCVGFNALAATTTTNGGNASTTDSGTATTTDNGTATTTDSGTATSTDSGSSSSSSSNGGGGGGGSSFGGGNWGGGCGAGFVWSASALKCVPQGQPVGQVLGASCGIYMNKYLMFGSSKNDPDTVDKLQTFLNTWMGTNLPLTGVYDTPTMEAVEAFQTKYANQVLKPWGADTQASGLVYLSTVWQINEMQCPALTLPYPTLIPWNQNPNAQ
jgi:hypothetical protein